MSTEDDGYNYYQTEYTKKNGEKSYHVRRYKKREGRRGRPKALKTQINELVAMMDEDDQKRLLEIIEEMLEVSSGSSGEIS